jgi:hypothetical protein
MSISGRYNIDDRMINEYKAVGGMRIGKGNINIWRKSATVSL